MHVTSATSLSSGKRRPAELRQPNSASEYAATRRANQGTKMFQLFDTAFDVGELLCGTLQAGEVNFRHHHNILDDVFLNHG